MAKAFSALLDDFSEPLPVSDFYVFLQNSVSHCKEIIGKKEKKK